MAGGNPQAGSWIGRITYQDGVVISDELLAERPLTLAE